MKRPYAHFSDTIAGMTDQLYAHMLEMRKTRPRVHITGGENSIRSVRHIKLYPPVTRRPELPDR